MPQLGGILHPTSFKMNELIVSMSHAFSTPPFEFLRHKNLELALFGDTTHSDEKKTVTVLLEGKIHNAATLRTELTTMGFPSFSERDEEVIFLAYKAWGEDFAKHLEGDFVIVLLDTKQDLVYLVRDRIGKKVLYWTTQGNYFLFSTELKGLLATGVVPQSPSPVGFSSYLYFGFIPQDYSPVLGVNKLLPGHFLKLHLDGRYLIDQYWSLSRLLGQKQPSELSDFEAVMEETLDDALRESGSVGVLEHGGSGINLIENILGKKTDQVRSIHPTLDDPETCLEDLVEVIWHLDEPTSDLSLPLVWQAAKMASNASVQTLFIDAGWEEMIAICASLKSSSFPLAYQLAKMPNFIKRYFLLPAASMIYPPFKWRILRSVDINSDLMGYLSQIALFKGMERKAVSPAIAEQFDPEVFIERFHRLSRVSGAHDLMFYFNAKTKVPDSVMLYHEKLFATHSINVIAPYLEEKVLNFAASTNLNIASSFFRGEEMVANIWCRSPYFREIFSLLAHGTLVRQEIINPKWIRHQLGYPYLVPSVFKKLWAILILEIWFRLFINQPIGKASLTMSVDELLRS